MVFFTAILITVILYYLQTDGLIYITIIAVAGEIINIFMTQTAGKAAEKKTTVKFVKLVQGYQTKIAAQKKTIKELEDIQEESVRKAMTYIQKISEYEEKLGLSENQTPQKNQTPALQEENKTIKQEPLKVNAPKPEKFIDLPSGSNRRKLPF